MDIEHEAEAQAAHAKVGQDWRIVRRQGIRNSLDCNGHVLVHGDVRGKPASNWVHLWDNRNPGPPPEGDFRLLQLVAPAAFISRPRLVRSR